jgi:hypothetical protein
MMAVLELYGKCKELGYCDCRGFFGCNDPESVQKPDAKTLEAASRRHEIVVNEKDVERYAESMPEWDKNPPGTLVECEVCDRSHTANHPHITNIEGDTPLDDEEPTQRKADPIILLPPVEQLPEWLRDKSGADGTEDDKPPQMCQVCGNPWAPRHACSGAQPPETDFNRPVAPQRKQTKCESCGLVRRSNHQCKVQPKADTAKVAQRCEDCERAGELCVRHGGRWADYDTPKPGKPADERIATTLPRPVSFTQPETTDRCRNGHPRTPENTYERSDGRRECKKCKKAYQTSISALRRLNRANGGQAISSTAEPDHELAAIGTILRAVDGLGSNQLKRVMSYVAARLEEAE